MVPIVSRIKAWWEAADRQQRIVTLGGTGALVLLLVGTAFIATRPHYETILEGLSDLEQGQDLDALTAAGIPAQAGDLGTIKVPSAQAKEAKMKLALAGKLPKGKGHITLPELKDMNPMDPPEKQAQTLKMIQEGEIRGILETMDGIAAANVIVTRPPDTAFADDKRRPTASVTLTEDGQGVLTAANGRTIASLVCSAVDGMTIQDVFVSSNSLGVLWDGHGGETTGMKSDLDAKTARDWEAKVRNALAAFGPDNIKVAVRADVDTSKRNTRTHDVTPSERPTSIQSRAEAMQGTASRPGGVPGAASNMPNPTAPAAPGAGSDKSNDYDGKEFVKTYGESTKDEEVEGGVGELKGLAISVTANADKIPDVAQVQTALDALMGGLIQRDANNVPLPNQPFSAMVASVKFDNGAELAAKSAADAAAGRERMQQIFSMLPIGAILLVALMVAKQVGKISKSVLPVPATMETVLEESVNELPGSELALLGEGVGALPMPGAGDDEGAAPFKLEAIKDRVDPALEGLKQMATERPEMVATLIKSMMLGERA